VPSSERDKRLRAELAAELGWSQTVCFQQVRNLVMNASARPHDRNSLAEAVRTDLGNRRALRWLNATARRNSLGLAACPQRREDYSWLPRYFGLRLASHNGAGAELNRARRLIGFGAAMALLAGCSDAQPTRATPSTSRNIAATSTSAASITTPLPAVSAKVSNDPKFSTSVTTFGRHDTVYIGITLGPGIDVGDTVFVWKGNQTGPNTRDLLTNAKGEDTTVPGTTATLYRLSSASGWVLGTYEAAVTLHGEVAQDIKFTIE
jgi:hypothetical protein